MSDPQRPPAVRPASPDSTAADASGVGDAPPAQTAPPAPPRRLVPITRPVRPQPAPVPEPVTDTEVPPTDPTPAARKLPDVRPNFAGAKRGNGKFWYTAG